MNQFRHTVCRHLASYLEMSSESTYEGEVSQYAYIVLRIFSPCPIEIEVLRHHEEAHDIFLHGDRADGPSPLTRMNKVEIFPLETLVL